MKEASVYKLSPYTADESTRLGELLEFRRQGESFIRQQRAFFDYDNAMDIIAGVGEERVPKALSRIKDNQLKRDIREVAASMSNMKPTWTYKSGEEKSEKKTYVLNKRQQYWYYQTFADMQVRGAFQYAGVLGTGWVVPQWKRAFWGFGKGDIELALRGPRDVLPIQLPQSNNIQEAYMTIIRNETPINEAWAKWPNAQHIIVPDRDSPKGLMRAVNSILKFASPALNVGGDLKGKESQNRSWPTVDIYYAYVMDLDVNWSDRPILMGEPGTIWSYTVPYVGQDIPSGEFDANGPKSRKAKPEDCLLYPNRRLVIFTNYGILRDGPNYDIHGMVPAVPFRLDAWSWEFLGYSLTRDASSIQQSIIQLLRGIDDAQKVRLRPPLVYNENLISENLASRFDPRIPGVQIPANLDMGKPFEVMIPYQNYDVPQTIFNHIPFLDAERKKLLGLNDLVAMAKAKQVPNSDSIEKFMEMAGPIMTDMSRLCESSMVQVAEIWKGLALQHYSTKDRMQKLGDDGLTEEDVDYEPGTMIPGTLPGENPNFPSQFSLHVRTKHAIDAISTTINPQSAHQINLMSQRMALLLLKKAGVFIDDWSIAKAFGLDNFGPEPKGTTNMIERYIAQMHMQRELAQEMGAATGQPPAKGRPNSNEKPPSVASKDGGTRATLKTS